MKTARTVIVILLMFFGITSSETLQAQAPTGWNAGGLFHLAAPSLSYSTNPVYTERNWNNIELLPGTYQWFVHTDNNNGKKGKVNFDIKVKYNSGPNSHPVNEKLGHSGTFNGTFLLPDYMSRSGGGAGYGKIKISIGRAGINTNTLIKSLTLTRIGGDPVNGNNQCTYTTLGSKNGNIISNTRSTYKTTKKSCKNTVNVRVSKTSGRARTTFKVYSMNSPNGAKTLVATKEFPNGNGYSTKTITVNNANNKYFYIELKNHSATNTFKFTSTTTQSD